MTLKDPFSIEDKVTIVTGGGTGIGASIAHEFASRGARLLIASRNLSHLEPVRDEIRKAGGKCEMAQCDRFQQQHSPGSGFASGDRGRSACQLRHEDRLSPGVRNHQ